MTLREFLCKIGFHNWSYGIGLSGNVEERTCTNCGKQQYRVIFEELDFWMDL